MQGWNDLVQQIETLRDEQVEQRQEKSQDRSEHWQEGETGQAVEAMTETWENLDFSTVEDPDVETLPSELEDLPQEPE